MKKKLFALASLSLLPLPIQQTISCQVDAYYMENAVSKDNGTLYVKKDILEKDNSLLVSPYWYGSWSSDFSPKLSQIDISVNGKELVNPATSDETGNSNAQENSNFIPNDGDISVVSPMTSITPIPPTDVEYYNYISDYYTNDDSEQNIYFMTLQVVFNIGSVATSNNSLINVKFSTDDASKQAVVSNLEINIILNYSHF